MKKPNGLFHFTHPRVRMSYTFELNIFPHERTYRENRKMIKKKSNITWVVVQKGSWSFSASVRVYVINGLFLACLCKQSPQLLTNWPTDAKRFFICTYTNSLIGFFREMYWLKYLCLFLAAKSKLIKAFRW